MKPSESEDMVFLTGGTRLAGKSIDRESLRTSAVRWASLAGKLQAAPGRVLMLVDACHAGHLDQKLLVSNDELARQLSSSGRAGAVVFAASKGRQLSEETDAVRGLVLEPAVMKSVQVPEGHGLFTAAILRSFEDADTDRNGDGEVQLSELIDEVSWRVTRSSQGKQTPWVVRREVFGDFRLGSVTSRR